MGLKKQKKFPRVQTESHDSLRGTVLLGFFTSTTGSLSDTPISSSPPSPASATNPPPSAGISALSHSADQDDAIRLLKNSIVSRLQGLKRKPNFWIELMDSQTQNASLLRLQTVEKRIVRVLELAGGVMEEFSNPNGPRKELVNSHCSEFMQIIKDIQVTLREEIKSACEYRPFEKCDYIARVSNEICCKKLEYVVDKLDGMKEIMDQYHQAT
uniref:Mediator of RNA polymerase II transcription subunit 11 n=2 Tax=Helianthus annuus TaxID=4232 RepID=A0A251UK73_HELAN